MNIASSPGPLEGRRIVITRAPEQAEELIRCLMDMGAEVLTLPMVRFADPQDCAPLDAAIADLHQFDWVIFTSANAVRFFLKRCRNLDMPFAADHLFGRPRIAVVGPATRDALEIQGLRAALMSAQSSALGLVAELAGQVAGNKILLPRSDIATGDLPAGLRASGASVIEVTAYRTLPPDAPDSASAFDHYVVTTLRNGDADMVTFFSPSAFHHFARAMGEDALRAISARVAFAALGPVTAAAIHEAGIPVACEAAAATSVSLVTALVQYFALPAAQRAPVSAPTPSPSPHSSVTEPALANSPSANPPSRRPPRPNSSPAQDPKKRGLHDVSRRTAAASAPFRSSARLGARDSPHHARLCLPHVCLPRHPCSQ